MGAASLAVVYVAFAITFVYLNLTSLQMSAGAAMNKAVSERLDRPWSIEGGVKRTLQDIVTAEDLVDWLTKVVASSIYEEQQTAATRAGTADDSNSTLGIATVGSFNRVLLMRITAKRRILDNNIYGKFKATARVNAYPKVLQGSSYLGIDVENTAEDKATVCMPDGSAPCFEWKEKGSYEEAGGYSVFIDPAQGPEVFRTRVQEWLDVGMFDIRLATFVLDLVACNTNTDLFLQRGWLFTFDFAGNCHIRNAIRGFSLKTGPLEGKNLEQWVLTLVLWVFVALFTLREVLQVYNLGFYQHFRHKGAWLDCFSLLLCAIVLLTYRINESASIHDDFTVAKLLDPSTMADVHQALTALGAMVEEQQYLIAFNLLLVFTRAVVLVAELQANFRLILEVLDQSSSTLAYFLVMFVLILLGFVFMGYFVFGAGYRMFSTPILAIYTLFSMLTGNNVFNYLIEADEVMAFIFFYAFYILFYLVFINVFVSILMAAYDAVVAKVKDTEDSPFTKIADEIKHEFVDRIIGFVKMVGGFIYRCPCVDSCVSCIWGCCPACSMPNVGKWCGWGKDSSQDDDTPRPSTKKGREKSPSEKREKSSRVEWFCVMAFMVNTVSFLSLQVRGEGCFNLGRSVVHEPLEQTQWVAENPSRVEDLSDVQSFEQVRKWTEYVISGLVYANPKCATLLPDGTATYTSANTQQGCNNTNDAEQLVQVVNGWNVGFMNTTFVRLTIKPACFTPTKDLRWREALPWQRRTPDVQCAFGDCVSTLAEYACQSPDGTSVSASSVTSIPVAGSSTEFYNWSQPETQLGSFNLKGGIVVSLGSSRDDSRAMLQKLEADDWFSQKTASMVFDWITYNGNLDMFTYTAVGFSLQASGRMQKSVRSLSFPLNIDEGGGFYSTDRIWVLVLFAIYVFMVLCQILEMVYRILTIKKGKTCKKAIFEFFTDLWNISDAISLFNALLTVIYFLMFALMGFRQNYKFSLDGNLRYQVPNSDEKIWFMPKTVDPKRYLQEDWYIFHQFERIEYTYQFFLTVSAINCFLFAIKVVKYVGQMNSVQVFSDTLDSGKTRNSYFAIVILLQMTGFALFFHIIFGEAVDTLSTWENSIVTLFLWMVGEYDMDPLIEHDEVVAIFWFCAFLVSFYFISTNMFLATMLSVYCDTVGAEDIAKAQLYRLRKEIPVQYHDKASMLDEIKPDNFDLKEGEVIVRDLKQDSQPAGMGVQRGHILTKINGEPKLWKEHCKSITEIFERGIPDEGVIHLEFVERLNKQDRGLKKMFSIFKRATDHDDEEVHVKPTCKNFWRLEGAIACIAREAANLESEEADEDGEGGGGGEAMMDEDDGEGGDESGSEDEGHTGRKSTDVARKARRRVRAKRKLDSLLFSRWCDGKRQHGVDGAVGTGHGWESFGGSEELGGQAKEIQYEADHLEVFTLREDLHKLPISGQEAWLDCLVSAVEREMDDDSVITDVLRTSEMQDAMKNKHHMDQKPIQEFYRHADEVVKMLEFKANKKYYHHLQIESEQRQEMLRSQNEVLHDYVCELETEFTKVMELIHKNRAKKEVMLTKLAGLLDRTMYRHLDKAASAPARPAISRGAEDQDGDRGRLPANGALAALRDG